MPEAKLTEEEVLNAFVEKMLTDKGVKLSPEAEADLKASLTEKLEEQIEQAVIRTLSDEQLADLDRKLEAGMNDDELEEFFAVAGIDADTEIATAMSAFRDAFMAMPATELEEA